MKIFAAVFVLFAVCQASFAQQKNNISSATVSFKIKNMGIQTGGEFKKADGFVTFNPNDLPGSHIEATVDAASVDTDNEMRDSHLKGDEFFDVTRYPKITMRSVSFKKTGNAYIGVFNLTIKDKTKPVNVPFTYTETGGAAAIKGSFKINRKDFGVGGNSLVLADEATITIEASVLK